MPYQPLCPTKEGSNLERHHICHQRAAKLHQAHLLACAPEAQISAGNEVSCPGRRQCLGVWWACCQCLAPPTLACGPENQLNLPKAVSLCSGWTSKPALDTDLGINDVMAVQCPAQHLSQFTPRTKGVPGRKTFSAKTWRLLGKPGQLVPVEGRSLLPPLLELWLALEELKLFTTLH